MKTSCPRPQHLLRSLLIIAVFALASSPAESAPVISGIRILNTSSNACTIAWNTDVPAEGWVEFGPTPTYSQAAAGNGHRTVHEIDLVELRHGTTYYFRVAARNAEGSAMSTGFTFTTPKIIADMILDNTNAVVIGKWHSGWTSKPKYGTNYLYRGRGGGTNYVQYNPCVAVPGVYEVFALFPHGNNRTTNATFLIRSATGDLEARLNQVPALPTWKSLGLHPFLAGTNGWIRVTDSFPENNKVVLADAIKLVYAWPIPRSVIQDLRVVSLTTNSASIAWSTADNADTVMEYGRSSQYEFTASNPARGKQHLIALTGLRHGTTYHFRAISHDVDGNTLTSADFAFTTEKAINDIIVDNTAAKFAGNWSAGTVAPGKYGADYRFCGKGNGSKAAHFTPEIPAPGIYEVSIWYSQGANRTTNAPLIVTSAAGAMSASVNQQVNGGKWVLIGDFPFQPGAQANVRMTDAFPDAGRVVIADAMKFAKVAPLPTSVISSLEVTGVTPDSAAIAWTTSEMADSRVDYGQTASYGTSVYSASRTLDHRMVLSGLRPGTTYHFKVTSRDVRGNTVTTDDFIFATTKLVDDIIIDNPQATTIGTWTTGTTATGRYGSDYRYSGRDPRKSVFYTPEIPLTGIYEVSAWYPQGNNRTTNACYAVQSAAGINALSLNQQINGGQWNVLGSFPFTAGTNGSIRITASFQETNRVVIADAIKLVFIERINP